MKLKDLPVLVALLLAAALMTGPAAGAAAPTSTGPTTTAASTATASTTAGKDVPWGIIIAAAGALLAVGVISLAAAGGLSRRPPRPPRSRPSPGPPAEAARLASATTLRAAPAGASARTATPPVPRSGASPPPRALEHCLVRWRRNGSLSAFVAVEEDDPDMLLARSPTFRWRSSSPPPRRAPIVAAHTALVEALEEDGWTLVDEGLSRRWFERRLTRP